MLKTVFLLLVLSCSGQVYSAETQSFIPSLKVSKSDVYLSDLLSDRTSGETNKEASKVLIAKLNPGDEITIESREISRLARKMGDQIKKIYIPSEVTIRRMDMIESFEYKIVEHVKSTSGAERVEILEFRFPENMLLGSEDIHLALPDQFKNGSYNLPLFDIRNGQRKNIGWVSGRFRAFKVVPVATRTLSIGSSLQEDDVAFEEREITRINELFPSQEQLASSVLRVPRRAGQIVSVSDLRRERLVRRGASVNAVIRSKDWSVKVTGKAKTAGYLGDEVQFLNPETKKVISAKIIGENLVEIVR